MRPVPARCPICESELTVVRLHCPSCDTSLEGRFSTGQFTNLSAEQIQFITTFVRCEGKINRVEQEIGLSYPTIRNRLHEVIRAMGFEPGKDEAPEVSEEQRRSVLDDLETGKISVEDAMRALRGEEARA
jgi:hypothetical protein